MPRKKAAPAPEPKTWEEAIFDLWSTALFTAYSLARAARAREIRGDRSVKTFTQGMHSYSAEWGRVMACEELLPGLSDLRFCGPELTVISMYRVAEQEANSAAVEILTTGEPAWAENW